MLRNTSTLKEDLEDHTVSSFVTPIIHPAKFCPQVPAMASENAIPFRSKIYSIRQCYINCQLLFLRVKKSLHDIVIRMLEKLWQSTGSSSRLPLYHLEGPRRPSSCRRSSFPLLHLFYCEFCKKNILHPSILSYKEIYEKFLSNSNFLQSNWTIGAGICTLFSP